MEELRLQVSLRLDRQECVSGESVFFDVAVTHPHTVPVELPDLEPLNRCVTLTLASQDGKELTADQMSRDERDGYYIHEPPPIQLVRLGPGKVLALRGDLLSWFGRVPAGVYKATATYSKAYRFAESEPSTLRILPAAPQMSSVPRWAVQVTDAPLTAAWVHVSAGRPACLFYQWQSPRLPRNPWHCIRAAELDKPAAISPACMAQANVPYGHVYWADGRSVRFAIADTLKGQTGKPAEVKLPFPGQPLDSALSIADGVMLMPFTDAKKTRLALLRVPPGGKAEPFELDLAGAKPIGPYVCLWEYDQRLHFAWVAPNRRQVEYAMLTLYDLEAGWVRRASLTFNDPVVWLQGFLDYPASPLAEQEFFSESGLGGPEEEEPAEAEDEEPRPMLFCITEKSGALGCRRAALASGHQEAVCSFGAGGPAGLRVIQSALTYDQGLALLLVDSQRKLYYASTMRRTITPLRAPAGAEIAVSDYPSLVAALGEAHSPWVHLRWVREKKSIEYLRLEPEDQPDAVEKAAEPSEPPPENAQQAAEPEEEEAPAAEEAAPGPQDDGLGADDEFLDDE